MPKLCALFLLLAWAAGVGRCVAVGPAASAETPEARELRTRLAAFHGRRAPQALDFAWPHLDSPDAAIRVAARLVIEAQPFDTWKERALAEKNTSAALEAMLALVHACPPNQAAALAPHLCEGITTLRIEQMSAEQLLATIRLTGLVLTRLGPPTEDERHQMIDLWTRFFPHGDITAKGAQPANRALCQLLVFLDAPGVAAKTLTLLRAAPTPELRAEYLAWLTEAPPEFRGDLAFQKRLAKIKKEAAEALSAAGQNPATSR